MTRPADRDNIELVLVQDRRTLEMSALRAQRIRRLPTEQEIPGSNPGKGSPFLHMDRVTTEEVHA